MCTFIVQIALSALSISIHAFVFDRLYRTHGGNGHSFFFHDQAKTWHEISYYLEMVISNFFLDYFYFKERGEEFFLPTGMGLESKICKISCFHMHISRIKKKINK